MTIQGARRRTVCQGRGSTGDRHLLVLMQARSSGITWGRGDRGRNEAAPTGSTAALQNASPHAIPVDVVCFCIRIWPSPNALTGTIVMMPSAPMANCHPEVAPGVGATSGGIEPEPSLRRIGSRSLNISDAEGHIAGRTGRQRSVVDRPMQMQTPQRRSCKIVE